MGVWGACPPSMPDLGRVTAACRVVRCVEFQRRGTATLRPQCLSRVPQAAYRQVRWHGTGNRRQCRKVAGRGRETAWVCLNPRHIQSASRAGREGGSTRPAQPTECAPCRVRTVLKTRRARPPDCCYPRHLSLRGRPRLAQGSLWGAGRPSKASNLTCGAQGVPPCHQPRSRPVVAPDRPIFARYRVLSPSAPWSYGYVVTQKTAATSPLDATAAKVYDGSYRPLDVAASWESGGQPVGAGARRFYVAAHGSTRMHDVAYGLCVRHNPAAFRSGTGSLGRALGVLVRLGSVAP